MPKVKDNDPGETFTFEINMIRNISQGIASVNYSLPFYEPKKGIDWDFDPKTGIFWWIIEDQAIWRTHQGFTREVEVRESGISVNGDKDLDEEAEPEMEEITITAWYTPEIPVSAGPRNYHGLPGLILEVDDGRGGTLMCSKVVLNPEKSIEIKEPKKGQKINQEKYDAIMEKKMEEMRERRRNSRERRDGNSVEIRIGG